MQIEQQKTYALFNCNLPADYVEYAHALMQNESLLDPEQMLNQTQLDMFESLQLKDLTQPDSVASLIASPNSVLPPNNQASP